MKLTVRYYQGCAERVPLCRANARTLASPHQASSHQIAWMDTSQLS